MLAGRPRRTPPIGSNAPRCGNSRPSPAPASLPVIRRWARDSRAGRALRVPRPVPRRMAKGDPPHEGPHRAGAHPTGRGLAVPPEARPRLALGCRVHRTAGTTRARRRNLSVRTPSTLSALDALVACELLAGADAERLREAYVLCERARNYRYLLTGASGDSLPTDGDEAEKLARCSATYAARNRRCARSTGV